MQDTDHNPSETGNKGWAIKRKALIALLLVGLIFLSSLALILHRRPKVSPAPTAAEDAAVFTYLLYSLAPRGTKMVVVKKETIPWSDLRGSLDDDLGVYSLPPGFVQKVKYIIHNHSFIMNDTGAFSGDMKKELARRNAKSVDLATIPLAYPVLLVDKTKLDPILNEGFWKPFYKHYPTAGGTASFSMPAYSSDHTQAIVYCSFGYGGFGGSSLFYHLVKKHGAWTIESSIGSVS